MRRMYTTEGIQKLIDGSIDEAFENLDDRKGVFEKIADKDGHLRFIDGNINLNAISGITKQYGKWSLSGSHLMLVLAFKVEANASLGNYDVLSNIQIPEWILNKIYPLGSGEGNWVSFKQEQPTNYDGIPDGDTRNFILTKQQDAVRIYHISPTVTPENDMYIRVQFDLLIDNE